MNDNNHIHQCITCGREYDVTTNYSDIKESGEYICNDCWDNN
jgi:DNA-directed RNA polymerase subunit RPC12/RpoP